MSVSLRLLVKRLLDIAMRVLFAVEPEAPEGRRSGGGSQSKRHRKLEIWTHNSPCHLPAFLEKSQSCQYSTTLSTCFYKKNPEHHLFDRGGWLNRSRSFTCRGYTRKVCLKRALPAPVLPPHHQGNGGSCPHSPRASGVLVSNEHIDFVIFGFRPMI